MIADQTIVFNIKPKRCHGFESSSSIVFSFKRIWRICLINEGFPKIIQKSIGTHAQKMPKKMFLYTRFRRLIFSVIIFMVVPLKSEIVYSLTHCLQVHKHLLLQSNLWFNLYVSWVTELVKIDVSLKFRHNAQRFPWHLHESVTLSRGYNLALTK